MYVLLCCLKHGRCSAHTDFTGGITDADVALLALMLVQVGPHTKSDSQAYSPEIFEDLGSRFEPPNAHTRWDSPLHVARPTAEPDAAAAAAAVAAGLSSAAPAGAPATGPLATISQDLQPNLATAQPRRAAATALHEVDRAAQAVVQRITEAQARPPPPDSSASSHHTHLTDGVLPKYCTVDLSSTVHGCHACASTALYDILHTHPRQQIIASDQRIETRSG